MKEIEIYLNLLKCGYDMRSIGLNPNLSEAINAIKERIGPALYKYVPARKGDWFVPIEVTEGTYIPTEGIKCRVHGFVMLQKINPGRYFIKPDEKRDTITFYRVRSRKKVIEHYASNVLPWITTFRHFRIGDHNRIDLEL